MREIKFRARVLKENEMVFVNTLYCNVRIEHSRTKNGYLSTPLHLLKLMQFTGLRDKNGKEIYEGDILRRPGYAEGLSDYIVGFDKGHFTLQHTKTAYNQLGIWNIADTTEVVGNIHENPELLTKEATQ